MSRLLLILPGVLAAGMNGLAQPPAIEPVLRAELAFARLAGQKGIRAAFLACLAEDARVFIPQMTHAREHYGREPGDPGQLAWYPEAMGISAAGDLAWSFDPWTYAAKKGGPVLVHGHFLCVWRQQADGRWKVAADIGVPHAAPGQPIEPFAIRDALPAARKTPPKASDAASLVRQKEAELSSAWAGKGGLALLPDLAKDARVLRPGKLPVRGTADLQKTLVADHPGPRWEPALLQVATSGDLAWTCGETGPDDLGTPASFLRIWILEAGSWKVLFDVRLPIPKPAS